MKKFVLGMLLTAIVIPSMPAMAQQDRSWSEDQRDEDSRANQNQRRHHANGHDDDRRDQPEMIAAIIAATGTADVTWGTKSAPLGGITTATTITGLNRVTAITRPTVTTATVAIIRTVA
jgi:hypothetical protein